MLKRIVFQTHWLLGITAGLVLAVVGVSGAMLSYKEPILEALNRDAYAIEAQGRAPLDKSELIAAIAKQVPDKRVVSLMFSQDPNRAIRVTLNDKRVQPREPAASQTKQSPPRRERRYVDPFTGMLLSMQASSSETFFNSMEQLHRNLLAGPIGKGLVGASTIVLVFMALSGLYLRWPRRALDWRVWLKMSFKLRGNAFWLRLHAVLGTWVLLSYLLVALTGLYFAYPWYRASVVSLVGAHPPARGPIPLEQSNIAPFDAERVWAALRVQHIPFLSAELTLPERASQAAELRYLPTNAPHERAFNRLVLRPDTGEVVLDERYEDRSAADRFVASMFPLHAGSYFGPLGLLIMMLASLAMPIFAASGWMLYLQRRRIRARGFSSAPSAIVIDTQ